MGALFWRELRSCALPSAVIACVLALYTGVIVSMYDPELGESLALMRESMPELFAAFGMGDQGTTLLEFLVNYLYGFLLVVFPLVLVILLVNRLLVRHVDRGTLACLLAAPVGRARLVLGQVLVSAVVLVALAAFVTAVELVAVGALFPGELGAGELLAANGALLGLWAFFAGVCWCSACVVPRPAASLWVGAGACVACVLAEMLSGVGEGLEWLASATPLALFDPLGVAAGDAGTLAGCAALAVAGVALVAVGAWGFSRRDLSV